MEGRGTSSLSHLPKPKPQSGWEFRLGPHFLSYMRLQRNAPLAQSAAVVLAQQTAQQHGINIPVAFHLQSVAYWAPFAFFKRDISVRYSSEVHQHLLTTACTKRTTPTVPSCPLACKQATERSQGMRGT
uniref:Uncharacterized protein n=1 Tax=Eutreptiella gymnastica TaxID=73025 RepID=A0A7S4FRR6_9EUGL